MSWFAIRFDGQGLAYAKLTRHDRSGRVHLLVGRPAQGPRGPIYPTWARLADFERLDPAEAVALLRRQYGNAQEVQPGIVSVDMRSDRLWADALQNLRAFEDLFGPPHIHIQEGYVQVYVESKGALSDAAIAGRLQGAAPEADVNLLPELDTSPWHGLDPRLLEGVA